MNRTNILIGFLFTGAFSMLIMSFPYFLQEDSGILKGKVFKDTFWYRVSFFTHIGSGLIAIILGPVQLFGKLEKNYSSIHKRIGYIYTLAVVGASITGLIIAQFAMGGMITRIGFSVLSLIWFSSLIMAITTVQSGEIAAHKKWMQINYAITFAAITQRTLLLFAFLPTISFIPVYQLSAWLPWMLNLSIVLWFRRRNNYQLAH